MQTNKFYKLVSDLNYRIESYLISFHWLQYSRDTMHISTWRLHQISRTYYWEAATSICARAIVEQKIFLCEDAEDRARMKKRWDVEFAHVTFIWWDEDDRIVKNHEWKNVHVVCHKERWKRWSTFTTWRRRCSFRKLITFNNVKLSILCSSR